MLACVLAYTLAWLPLNVYIVLKDLPSGLLDSLTDAQHFVLFFIVHWLAMSHTCYNPFIYFWMNSKFRAGYYRALSCMPCVGHTRSRSWSSTHSEGTDIRSGLYSNYLGATKSCSNTVELLRGSSPQANSGRGPAEEVEVVEVELETFDPHKLSAKSPGGGQNEVLPRYRCNNHNNHSESSKYPTSAAELNHAFLYVVFVPLLLWCFLIIGVLFLLHASSYLM